MTKKRGGSTLRALLDLIYGIKLNCCISQRLHVIRAQVATVEMQVPSAWCRMFRSRNANRLPIVNN